MYRTTCTIRFPTVSKCLKKSSRCGERAAQMSSSFSRTTTRDLSGHTQKVHCVAWNGSGDTLASGSVDHTARLWRLDARGNGSALCELRGHTDAVDQLCWDPTNNNCLATASGDKTVRVWDSRSGPRQTHALQTSGENINISWSPDGKYIAVGNKDDCISIIDTSKYKIVKRVQFTYEVNEFAWSPNGEYFFLSAGQTSFGSIEAMKYRPDQGLESFRTVRRLDHTCVRALVNVRCII